MKKYIQLAKYFSNYIGYFYGLLIVIIMVNLFSKDLYGDYLLAGFYSSVVLTLFSSKPFAKLIADSTLNYGSIMLKEFFSKILGACILFLSVVFLNVNENLLLFLFFLSLGQMFKIADGCFEHFYLKRSKKYLNLFWFNLIFKTFSFVLSTVIILCLSIEVFVVVTSFLSLLEQVLKIYILYRKEQISFENISYNLFRDVYFQQNIFGKINKQFDTVLIFILGGGSDFSYYLLLKQFGSTVSNLSTPISHITSKFGYRYASLLCIAIISFLVVGGGEYGFFTQVFLIKN